MTDIAGFEYPLGVVKRTWTGQGPRGADDISMEDVIGNAASIEAAILCSHQYDFDWIASLLDVAESRVSVTLYAQTIDEVRLYGGRSGGTSWVLFLLSPE